MRKYIIFAMALVVLAACSHSDGKGMGTTTNLDSNVIPTFKELSIDFGQAVAPEWVNELVVIKNTPQIERIISRGAWAEDSDAVNVQVICKGVVPLKQEEYDDILQLIVDADLENYSPPEDCDVLVGTTGITIDFQKLDGIEHGFHTFCELDPEIDTLVKGVSEYANELIPDCDRGMAEPVSEEATDEEQSPEGESSVK